MTTQSKKHWSAKSDLKHDELRDALEVAFDWTIANRGQAAGILGGVVVAAALVGLFFYSRHARENAAWNDLTLAEGLAAAGKAPEAQAKLAQIAAQGGAAGGMARILDGDIHFQAAEYDKALDSYNKAADEAPESLKPFALADKVATLEASGKPDQCVSATQSFLDTRGDNTLAPQIQATLARCQQAEGQAEAAKATLQKMALQYQNSFWEQWAKNQLNPPAPVAAAPAAKPKAKKR
jgi:tetratricopeptide (TPR) repeat protein